MAHLPSLILQVSLFTVASYDSPKLSINSSLLNFYSEGALG
jgi:hypothetical protein